jgi:hypothetical protein
VIATGHASGEVKLWEVETGKPIEWEEKGHHTAKISNLNWVQETPNPMKSVKVGLNLITILSKGVHGQEARFFSKFWRREDSEGFESFARFRCHGSSFHLVCILFSAHPGGKGLARW